MAEYIEKEAVKRLINNNFSGLLAAIDSIPAADVAPVVHGRWVKHTRMHGFVYCSACRDVYLDAEWLKDGKWTYCPNCGAKMDGGADRADD